MHTKKSVTLFTMRPRRRRWESSTHRPENNKRQENRIHHRNRSPFNQRSYPALKVHSVREWPARPHLHYLASSFQRERKSSSMGHETKSLSRSLLIVSRTSPCCYTTQTTKKRVFSMLGMCQTRSHISSVCMMKMPNRPRYGMMRCHVILFVFLSQQRKAKTLSTPLWEYIWRRRSWQRRMGKNMCSMCLE